MTTRALTYICFIVAFVLTLILFVKFAHADVIITNDNGGAFSTYVSKVQALRTSRERVVIDGPCESACMLYLNLPADQICATSRGRFGFHSARDGFGLPNPAANEELLRVYPGKVRNFVVRHYDRFMIGVVRVSARAFVQPCSKRDSQ